MSPSMFELNACLDLGCIGYVSLGQNHLMLLPVSQNCSWSSLQLTRYRTHLFFQNLYVVLGIAIDMMLVLRRFPKFDCVISSDSPISHR